MALVESGNGDVKTEATVPYPRPLYAWYVVALLIVAYIVAFIDRGILALLIEPIKADLGLSDVQMAWLMGPAFGIFYATLGIPIGVLADRSNRRNIIVVGVALWSAATAACGLAANFLHLFVSRIMVGVGEATLSPSAYSMISDYFPRRTALKAIGLYTMGQSIGAGLAFLLGAQVVLWVTQAQGVVWPLVGELEPWQMTFVVVGLPGILLAVVMLTIREPLRRGFMTGGAVGVRKRLPVADTARFVLQRWRTFGAVFLGNSVITTIGYSYFWLPSMFQRTWGLDAATAGLYYGGVLAVFGPLGVITGARVSEVLYRRGRPDAPYLTFLASVLLALPFAILVPLAPGPLVAVALLCPAMFAMAMASASSSAAVVHVAPAEFRAQISALYLLVISLAGLFLGPTSVAMLTDYVFRDEALLRYSLLLVTVVVGSVGLVILLLGRTNYRRSAEEADAWHQP
ncbi:MAG: MFS transporter [Gammaproteobacteria bacterium]|nr:MFS transporter [Gammaproteobacteria bacterium]